ncbi:MAG: phosphotransferase, partial [Pseudomonadota bacterium]
MSGATDLDVAAVDQYLSDHLAGYQGPLSARKFAQGQSNPTFELTTPNASYVLRRKPPGVLLKSAHAVDREFRVQRALAASDVPVAKMHLLCEDDTVIGSAFYVMERVVGHVHGDPRLGDVDKSNRAIIFNALNATLAA